MEEISAVNDAYKYLTTEHGFNEPEVEYLLKFQNPLRVVADCWPIPDRLTDIPHIMWEIIDKEDALNSGNYALITDITEKQSSVVNETSEKPSLLAQLDENVREIKAEGKPEVTKKAELSLV